MEMETEAVYSGITTNQQSTAAAAEAAIATNVGTNATSSRVQSSFGHNLLQQLFDDMKQIEDTVDSIEIPARGRCKVYMAKYGYDPFKQSPNENPDAELAFNAGDYIMVFDDIDEDGYFIGELMDGRRGYVPSNWLDRLTGEDLFEFQATTLYKPTNHIKGGAISGGGGGIADDTNSETNSYPPEFYDAIVSDTLNHSNFKYLLAPEDYHRMNDYVDLNDVNEVDDECLSDYERAEAEQMRKAVQPPQRLILERQLNKSILIGWLHPQATKGTIVSYQVYVDGVLKSTVPSGDRTKALLEGVDSNIPHRISVRAIDLSGRHSNDAGCTIVIGQKIPFAPSCVKASHITSDSALISWLPCNSNFHHVVAVNSVEVQTVRPGIYKHLINGLSANTLYRVWVRAKPGKILSIDEKNPKKLESLTTYVDFKTMPKSLPDPPVNVQVEAGPQRRTLLVTWLPLTLNDFGSSNGCAVTGYAVFAGHKKLADIDSPTGDHALLDLSDLESLHKKSVTVRTKSGENLSQDSMPCQIPDEYLKQAISVSSASKNADHHSHFYHSQQQQQQQNISGQQQQQNRYGYHQQHHRLSDTNLTSTGGHYSPLKHHQQNKLLHHQQQHHSSTSKLSQAQRQLAGGSNSRYSQAHSRPSRQITRSLQNLESDLDSRRSSIPAIEITRETSVSDLINQTESYSEEEFENSMRFRGIRGKPGSRMNSNRYRTRQSHSVDGSANRYQQQQAKLIRGTPIDRDIRYFVALFDYDPSTMSPNPNAASEELAFKEGSIIKVIGDKGPDGFYRGELDNHIGYVPCNVVSEITDPNLLYNLSEKNRQVSAIQSGMSASNQFLNQQQQQSRIGQQPTPQLQQQQQQQIDSQQQQQQLQNGVKRMTALYDYDPQENSPNADTESEIPFKVNDVIYVYGKMDTDGFYMGEVERTKQRGLVPSNFLREDPVPAKPATMLQQQQQPVYNQMTGQPIINQIDLFSQQHQQQQRPPNPNQFIGGAVQPQQQQRTQQTLGNQMDSSTPFITNPSQLQQQQQQIANQQQMNKMQNPRMRGGNIRGILPTQNQRGPAIDSMQQQSINRPTTLSLGIQGTNQQQQTGSTIMNDWSGVNAASADPRQQLLGNNQMQAQQQQQQQIQGQLQNRPLDNIPIGAISGTNQQQIGNLQANQMSNLGMMQAGQNKLQQQQQQPQQQIMNMTNQQQLQQQQQHQQPTGGVLSNLLSSGKQIIGAATTPRAPNQPGQFPSMNQMGNYGNGTLGGIGGGGGGIGGGAMNMMDAARGGNLMQTGFNTNDPSQLQQLQQQQHQPMQQQHQPMQQTHNSFNIGGSGNQMHPQQQQQQHYNQMGLNRGPLNPMGEEQGGNILNTVKNMFKL